MIRGISDRNMLDEFAVSFCSVIEKFTKYIVVSGFLVISSGRIRSTEDIDMIIEPISKERFEELHKALIENDFICMQSDNADVIYSYLKDKLSVRYTYKDIPLPEMEVKFAVDELDRYQLNTRTKIPSTDVDIYFGSIDMNIAFKEEYLKSEKDLEDAKHLRKVYFDKIDEKEIESIKQKIKMLRLK